MERTKLDPVGVKRPDIEVNNLSGLDAREDERGSGIADRR